MADMFNEAHAAITDAEQNSFAQSPENQIAIAHVKVLLGIAQLLDERLPRPAPPGAWNPNG